jgi:penicillin-binding protein activator
MIVLSRFTRIVGMGLAIAALASPAEAQKPRQGQYVDPGKVTAAGNKYSDTDLRLLTSTMVESMMTSTFHTDQPSENRSQGDRPIIAMGQLENRTTQDIDVKLILDTIEVSVLKSRAARFVNRSKAFQTRQADERALGDTFGAPSAAPAPALQTYQYLLEGELYEIPSQDRKLRYYRLSLSLTDIRTSEKVWADEKELKKVQK